MSKDKVDLLAETWYVKYKVKKIATVSFNTDWQQLAVNWSNKHM